MIPRTSRALYLILTAAVAIGLGVVALRPAPIAVDVAEVASGPLLVTIDEEGQTRAVDRYIVAAPVAGRMLRIALHDGDPVMTGDVLARLAPLPLSARECAEQQARVSAAEARQRAAEEAKQHAESDYGQARRESERMQSLFRQALVSTQAAEQARNAETTARNEVDAARESARAAAADVALARAGLVAITRCEDEPSNEIVLRAPVDGRVLRIVEKSERVVEAGAPLLVIGDPRKLEVVVDVLSSDAVRIRPGMAVQLDGWGGDQPLKAIVRSVEPYGFTKVSALGIEEQRVNVIIDFIDPPASLGDGFRVDARIVTAVRSNVLQVPSSAVFRHGEGMAVFVVEGERAQRRAVTTGLHSDFNTEIEKGLAAGERTVLYPPRDLADGMRVRINR